MSAAVILAITAVYTVLGKFHRTSLIHLYISSSFVLHLFIICTSSTHWLNLIRTSFVPHLYVIYTSFVRHLYFICTSFVLHLYAIRASSKRHLYFPYTSSVLYRRVIHLYFICTSFVLHKCSRTLLYGHPLITESFPYQWGK